MGTLRILIVEDDPDSNEVLRLLLEAANYEVRTAFSARAAIELATEHAPDLAFIDIGLPELDGFALLAVLRAQRELRQTKFVAITGYDLRMLPSSPTGGFDHYLLKPVGPEAILGAVSALFPAPDR